MIWMAASDIHGAYEYCEELLECYEKENAEELLLLGDLGITGVGPCGRTVGDLLNQYAGEILCVSGNCDSVYDQAALDFNIMEELWTMYVKDHGVHLTHGHLYGPGDPPKHDKGDILLCGHTHVPACREYGDYLYINPGSVGRPREGSWHGYLILTEDEIVWKDLDREVQMKFDLLGYWKDAKRWTV